MKKIYISPITRIEVVEMENFLAPGTWIIKGDKPLDEGGQGGLEIIGNDENIHDGDEITG